MAARYRDAVEWIAFNATNDETTVEDLTGDMLTALVADIFGKERDLVARSVMNARRKAARDARR